MISKIFSFVIATTAYVSASASAYTYTKTNTKTTVTVTRNKKPVPVVEYSNEYSRFRPYIEGAPLQNSDYKCLLSGQCRPTTPFKNIEAVQATDSADKQKVRLHINAYSTEINDSLSNILGREKNPKITVEYFDEDNQSIVEKTLTWSDIEEIVGMDIMSIDNEEDNKCKEWTCKEWCGRSGDTQHTAQECNNEDCVCNTPVPFVSVGKNEKCEARINENECKQYYQAVVGERRGEVIKPTAGDWKTKPYGCSHQGKTVYFNPNKKSIGRCGAFRTNCICKKVDCNCKGCKCGKAPMAVKLPSLRPQRALATTFKQSSIVKRLSGISIKRYILVLPIWRPCYARWIVITIGPWRLRFPIFIWGKKCCKLSTGVFSPGYQYNAGTNTCVGSLGGGPFAFETS